MSDHERRRHDLEAEDALRGGLLDASAGECPQSSALQIRGYPPQHLGEIGARSTAGIEDVDVVRRQAVGNVQVVAERLVHPSDHVLHNFRRRVPDAQLLPKRRVECLQERFVEVGNRFALVEAGEERRAIHPIQSGCRPIQHFDQAERSEASRIGKLLEERPQNRRSQMPNGGAPVEHAAPWRLPRPQHPGGEDPVEERLHQRRVEEPRSPLALEPHPKRLLQRRANGSKRR